MPTCGAVKHAVKAEQLGADIVIVQGGEGGGHTGSVPTTLLASAAADAVKVPVVAAGGFKDGRGLVAALAFGAEGVAMGTRFLMTQESPVPDVTLARYLGGGGLRRHREPGPRRPAAAHDPERAVAPPRERGRRSRSS